MWTMSSEISIVLHIDWIWTQNVLEGRDKTAFELL